MVRDRASSVDRLDGRLELESSRALRRRRGRQDFLCLVDHRA
jgi:hypothetical protein